jgi:hypothetical protein
MDIGGWTSAFADLEQEWRSIAGERRSELSVEDWARLFEELKTEQGRLKGDGRWVSGHADLMHLAGVADLEVSHSNIVAWLLNPAGRHGFSDRLLRAILEDGWRDSDVPSTASAVVEREVPDGSRIADIVIYMGPTTLVIENKVLSDESKWQCEDLYQIWSGRGKDVRFLLLTRDGHPPRETQTQAAADTWRRLSYPSLAGWLHENLPTPPQSLAQKTVEQYVETIRLTCRGRQKFHVEVGGGHVSE